MLASSASPAEFDGGIAIATQTQRAELHKQSTWYNDGVGGNTSIPIYTTFVLGVR